MHILEMLDNKADKDAKDRLEFSSILKSNIEDINLVIKVLDGINGGSYAIKAAIGTLQNIEKKTVRLKQILNVEDEK